MQGVDYSWGRPDLDTLRRLGYRFAVRYLSYDAPPYGKVLTRHEAQAISDAGLGVVLVWEWQVNDALGGHTKGIQHAREAVRQAREIGAPDDVVIYFAVDFDPNPTQWGTVRGYFEGVCSVIPFERVGVYGGIRTIDFCHTNSLARWLWQTYAWSGGQWHTQAHARQYRNGAQVAGADVDLNEAMAGYIGQFMFTGPGGTAEKIGDWGMAEQDARHAALLVVVGNTEVGREEFAGADQLAAYSLRQVEARLTTRIAQLEEGLAVKLSDADRDAIVEQLRIDVAATLDPLRELVQAGKAVADVLLGRLGG